MASCPCEGTPQSEHPGPGPVKTEEKLLRLVYYNEHINSDGTLKSTAINKSELTRQKDGVAPDVGCSVFRREHADVAAITSKASAQQTRAKGGDNRHEIWAYGMKVDLLRGLKHEGDRAVCVVDRAEPDDPSHAEIWGAKAGRGKGALRQIRDAILALMSKGDRVL